MSWHWKELLPVDRLTVRTADYLTNVDQQVLTLLYQPLTGALAYSLYMTLWGQLERDQYWGKEQTHRQLMLMMGVSLQTIYEERKKLEAIGLLKTFKKKEDESSSYLYELQAPMSPQQFFENDVLSVYLFNRLGKNQYRSLRERFVVDKVNQDEFVELTYSFDEVYTSLHHSEIVSNLQSETGDGLRLEENKELLSNQKESDLTFSTAFDFELLKKALSSFIIPEHVLTPSVKEAIIKLAFVYRIEPLEMSHIVQQAAVHDDEIELAELRKKAQEWYKLEHGSEPPSLVLRSHPIEHQTMNSKKPETEEEKIVKLYETTPPLTLLEIRSDGAKVALADVKIIESLILDYQMLPGVVNVLLDYVLWLNDMKLSKAFIDKIAGHWSRKKVKTVPAAMELARQEEENKVKVAQVQAAKKNTNPTQRGKNIRRDKLPKWLVEEKQKQKESSEKLETGKTVEQTSDAKHRFEQMMEELKRRKEKKGEV
ncbi:replication initiation and membrane attachment family protein [Halalkalibacter urbisdiaboli]|uniref:replication initiation and membrane attachment family protein n=1 Tax=Halalkalibacter urbisdiaboli TaxID=1960589 RepID=UPI000B450B63|nr:replication initiation and membrane attachment family protein [Halalkalibacter urbisdiaboli]